MTQKHITREITRTTIESVKVEIVEGNPTFKEQKQFEVIGNISMDKATKLAKKQYGDVTVTKLTPNTKKYAMPLDQFLELATEVKAEEEKEVQEELEV